jgi:hypothetical protein
LKIKRIAIAERSAARIDALYARNRRPEEGGLSATLQVRG